MGQDRRLSPDAATASPPLSRLSPFAGIRGQMLIAAGVVLAGMAVAGLLIAAAFASMDRRLDGLSAQSMPALEAVLKAAQASAQVVADLPQLTAARTQSARQEAEAGLAERLARLAAYLEDGAWRLSSASEVAAQEANLTQLQADVAALNDAIFERIDAERQIAAVADGLASRRAVLSAALPNSPGWAVALSWVLEIGRIDRAMIAAGVRPPQSVRRLSPFPLPHGDPRGPGQAADPPPAGDVGHLLTRLNDLVAVQRENRETLEGLTDRLQGTAAQLSMQMHQAIERTHDRWRSEAAAVEHRLTTLGRALAALAAAMVVVMGLFLWLYVGRRLIARITRLSAAAQRLSAGDLGVVVADRGRDELGELARAMVLFRDAMAKLARQARELADRNAQIDRTNQELDRLSRIDPLTGTYNRRYLMARMARQDRGGQPDRGGLPGGPSPPADPAEAVAGEDGAAAPAAMSLLLMDLDRFKAINDRYGHVAGDEALRRFARTCQGLIRRHDVLARYGGEEFVVLMPGAGIADALGLAERLRVALADLQVPAGDRLFGFTVSIGAAERLPDEPMNVLLRRADRALYRAKQAGRNRVEMAA